MSAEQNATHVLGFEDLDQLISKPSAVVAICLDLSFSSDPEHALTPFKTIQHSKLPNFSFTNLLKCRRWGGADGGHRDGVPLWGGRRGHRNSWGRDWERTHCFAL